MRIDHVIIGARQIDPVRAVLRDGYGFGIVPGSSHPDGTQGWFVPFGTPDVQYLEILTPHDEGALAGSTFGKEFLERTHDGPTFLNWAALSGAIDQDAARVQRLTSADPGLLRGESVRPDGRRFPWAEAGFDASWQCPSRPFFLEYGNWPARSARVPGDLEKAGHRVTPLSYRGISVSSGLPDLAAWWAPHVLPVDVVAGAAEEVRSVLIGTTAGEARVDLR